MFSFKFVVMLITASSFNLHIDFLLGINLWFSLCISLEGYRLNGSSPMKAGTKLKNCGWHVRQAWLENGRREVIASFYYRAPNDAGDSSNSADDIAWLNSMVLDWFIPLSGDAPYTNPASLSLTDTDND